MSMGRGVDEARLALGAAQRLGLDERAGDPHAHGARGQELQGLADVGLAVAEIGAKAEVDGGHSLSLCCPTT